MARTASSLASPSVTSAISLHIARLTALRIFGRLNTTVAMPPSRSTRISSLMPFPLCAPPGCLPRAGQSIGSVGELQLSLRKAFGAGCIFWDTPGTNMASGSPARFRGVRLGLALALLAAALAPVSRAVPDEAAWQVYFSPNHGATKAVVDALDGAKSTVLVQAYSFTSAAIAKALVEAHDRGVDVQVILDRKETGSKYSSADFVAHAGISTLIDGKHAIAHNKVMIIDGVAVITGSFNFTTAAERQNAENLLVIHDRALAARYTENWRAHAAHSSRDAGR